MSKLTHEFVRLEHSGTYALLVKKARGKITIDELGDYLRYDAKQHNHWVIILNANESTCGVGWPDEESKGDSILLYEAEPESSCPVCAKMLPPEYCPHCGEKIMEDVKNA